MKFKINARVGPRFHAAEMDILSFLSHYGLLVDCCAGEYFVHLPSMGYFHLPSRATQQWSIALPVLSAALLIAALVTWLAGFVVAEAPWSAAE